MLLKAVALFLVFMVVMASIHRFTGRKSRQLGIDNLRCPRCKKIRLSRGPCPCSPSR
jgi:hypothetical protein